MATGLPILRLGDRISMTPDGVAYELESGDVLLVALCLQFDADDFGIEKSRDSAVAKAWMLLPEGYGQPEPKGEWVDLLAIGYYGVVRKFIAKKLETAP